MEIIIQCKYQLGNLCGKIDGANNIYDVFDLYWQKAFFFARTRKK